MRDAVWKFKCNRSRPPVSGTIAIDGTEFSCIRIDSEATAYIDVTILQELIDRGQPVIPFCSPGMLDCTAATSAATPEQVSAMEYGVAHGYCGDIMSRHAVRGAPILFIPRLLARLCDGQNPAGVDTRQLRTLAGLGQQFLQPPGPSAASTTADSSTTCIVCFEHPPQYRWEACNHYHSIDALLICHRCYNELRRLAEGGGPIRGAAAPSLPCFVCRRVSRVVGKAGRVRHGS